MGSTPARPRRSASGASGPFSSAGIPYCSWPLFLDGNGQAIFEADGLFRRRDLIFTENIRCRWKDHIVTKEAYSSALTRSSISA
jgi:hypothetical protein